MLRNFVDRRHARMGRTARLAGVLLAGVVMAGTPAYAFQQSPMLDAMVKSGDLPPVDQRLPADPLVVKPVDSIGQYGGTWHSALQGSGDNAWIARTVAYDGLVRYDRDWKTVIPNLAEKWDVSDDATAYTFHLRKGLKWSDGTPFTSADIAFAIQLMQNPDYPAGASFANDPSNPMTVEVKDPQTFTFKFQKPYGLLMDDLASVNGLTVVSLQKKYCSQFYPADNKNADADAKKAGYQGWSMQMQDKCAWGQETQRWGNLDLPFMNAWIIKQPWTANAQHVVFERNPYYWKVDPKGNQLPYIDKLDMKLTQSPEEQTLMALNGQIDFTDRHINTVANQPVLYDGQDKGGYHLGKEVPSTSNTLVLELNLNIGDKVKNALYNDKNFRIGLSYGINRQEIIDSVFTSQGIPYQVAPRPESPFYDKTLATQYTAYDVDKANEYLDKAGLTKKNGDGIRLMSDGRPCKITVDVINALHPEWVDMLQLMQLQLKKVGIDLAINTQDRTLFYDERPGNKFDAQVWGGDGGLGVINEPRYYFPSNAESAWAFRWQAWYTGTNKDIAEEPPAWAKQQMKLYDELKAASDPAKRSDLMKQILKITQEQFPVIGVSLYPDSYYIAKNDLHNVAKSMKQAWLFPNPAPYDPFQWYFAK